MRTTEIFPSSALPVHGHKLQKPTKLEIGVSQLQSTSHRHGYTSRFPTQAKLVKTMQRLRQGTRQTRQVIIMKVDLSSRDKCSSSSLPTSRAKTCTYVSAPAACHWQR